MEPARGQVQHFALGHGGKGLRGFQKFWEEALQLVGGVCDRVHATEIQRQAGWG